MRIQLVRIQALTLFVLLVQAAPMLAQEQDQQVRPIRALLIAGGCCHDYPKQNEIIRQGVSQRANVQWELFHGGTDRDRTLPIYQTEDWARGYDIIVHNECYGGVTDVDYVERIVKGHTKHQVPAVVIHCSMHSYRAAKTDEWRKLLGVTSRRHEPGGGPLQVIGRQLDHPILQGTPPQWKTPFGELYVIEKTWPNMTTLATAYGTQTQQDHPVIWVNEFEGVRLFGTTLGHHNETMLTDEWLDIVSRGILWACGKLDDDGNMAAGFQGSGKGPILLPGIAAGPQGEPTPAEQ